MRVPRRRLVAIFRTSNEEAPLSARDLVRIVVLGTGGVGGYFGGRSRKRGSRSRSSHVAGTWRRSVAKGCASKSIAGDFLVHPAEASDDPASLGPADVVLVAVKAWQVPEAALALRPLLRGDSVVIPLQNGVEAAESLRRSSARSVWPAACAGSWHSLPGPAGTATPASRRASSSASATVVRASAWAGSRRRSREGGGLTVAILTTSKRPYGENPVIAPLSAVGAVTRVPVGVFRAIPETRAMLEAAMREVFALAAARRVVLRADALAKTLGFVDAMPPEATASMQRDILKGRPSELEAQTGTVVRLARAAGIGVPVNETIYRALLPLERKARGVLESKPRLGG